ncbi:hypothetical protein BIV24_10190 [Streptomyces colonosanans]|uniref:DUF3152 domain-containing protein n=1 Tax=Streptomyces colonosanans TaxID=1428652 RepID=A0A1S2PMW6_9ACTN|nr:hypothetical protein BIV24_10190 [Streptomyces colonosanans]
MLGGLATLAALLASAAVALESTETARGGPATADRSPGEHWSPGGHRSTGEPRSTRSELPPGGNSPRATSEAGTPSPSASKPTHAAIRSTGPGTFATAPGQSGATGEGRVLRYKVEVEDGISASAADVAAQVERILADPRGWTAHGGPAFRRVSSGTVDFAVKLATPGTVDRICGQYGLDTGGEVNCDVGGQVMVNLRRWLLATPVYASDVDSYRALIINHEVGHFLGHGHEGCPGVGSPAPVMMQQIKGMHGCTPNVWPFTAEGRAITGPHVP